MRISVACDHGALELKNAVVAHLQKQGHEVHDFGTHTLDSCDYPDFAEKAAAAVASGECDKGILICGTGIGMSMAANKVKGIRAALCHNEFTAQMCREHNNAQIVSMGARVIDEATALEIVDIFLNTEFAGGRHTGRVEKLMEIENR